MILQNKRLLTILLISVLLLIVPFVAMQLTNEVNWSFSDFAIAGVLLFGTGLLIELALRKTKKFNHKIIAIVAIAILFLLVWAELAVGIFGTPFAGS